MIYDHIVIGGGIVGMASAMALLRRQPGAGVLVLEKEAELARHQTGHNSGVVHSGIYYEPGSLKAELCRRGAEATREFCAEHGIPVTRQGKLLVATDGRDAQRLEALVERAAVNRIEVTRVGAGELRELEPNVAGVAALLVHGTGSVDYTLMTRAMHMVVAAAGGQVETGRTVTAITEGAEQVVVTTDGPSGRETWRTRRLVVCGGLQADRLAAMAGVATTARIVPFRGEYYRLPAERAGIVRRLIYPVPDPALPFLGVHLTPMVDGSTTVGPNAVLGLSREGYRKGSVDLRDVRDVLAFPGFWHVARRHARTGVVEMRNSLFRRGYLAAARRYCPDLQLSDLLPHEAGIRAQAVLRDGTLVHDFLVERTPRSVHVLNAPSPAATSAIPIGEMIAGRVLAAAA
ncbi:L-2-hydroxyglutarate oxidase [Geodermatophilus sp. SYSU D01036]